MSLVCVIDLCWCLLLNCVCDLGSVVISVDFATCVCAYCYVDFVVFVICVV